MTLEQQLLDLIQRNGLEALSLHVHPGSSKPFYCYTHAEPGLCCVSDNHDTASFAILDAIGQMHAKRCAATDDLQLAALTELPE